MQYYLSKTQSNKQSQKHSMLKTSRECFLHNAKPVSYTHLTLPTKVNV